MNHCAEAPNGRLAPRAGPTTRITLQKIGGFLFVFTFLCGSTMHGQESRLILPLTSKIEAPKAFHRSRLALDPLPVALGIVQGGAELFDGIGTRRYVQAPLCRSCTEGDPVSRFFLGPRPRWARMIVYGSVEDLAATYLHQSMRRSPHKLLRWLAPAAPLTLAGIHIVQGYGVFNQSTNVCSRVGSSSGYYPVPQFGGFTCVRSAQPLNVGGSTPITWRFRTEVRPR
jgi:hypothetical protein